MANNYFQFKQFIIEHDRCAMKVCTDACIFGAWFAGQMDGVRSILDIGSGSGLLMLMLAQRSNAVIQGIEMDPGAFEQSIENIRRSGFAGRPLSKEKDADIHKRKTTAPHGNTDRVATSLSDGYAHLPDKHTQTHTPNGQAAKQDSLPPTPEKAFSAEPSERLSVFHGDARHYAFPGQYDFIISNPPFYEYDLQSSSNAKNAAKHSTALDFRELLTIIDNNLSAAGTFGVLLPFHRWERFDQLASKTGFKPISRLFVRQSPNHDYFRAILHYDRKRPAKDRLDNSDDLTEPRNEHPAVFKLLRDMPGFSASNDVAGEDIIASQRKSQPGYPAHAGNEHSHQAPAAPQYGLTIREAEALYSPAFIALLKDYYLHL
ncbi:MAG TPA: hypothetical protein PK339_15530 [Flavitalea sp.]|nr:hypothetical protein [Flavitalea sp.]